MYYHLYRVPYNGNYCIMCNSRNTNTQFKFSKFEKLGGAYMSQIFKNVNKHKIYKIWFCVINLKFKIFLNL